MTTVEKDVDELNIGLHKLYDVRFGFKAGLWRPSVLVAFSSVIPVTLLTSLPELLKPEVELSPLPDSTSLDADVRLLVRAGGWCWSPSIGSTAWLVAVSDSCWSTWIGAMSSVAGGHASRRCADSMSTLRPGGRAATGGLRLRLAGLLSLVAGLASVRRLESWDRPLRCRWDGRALCCVDDVTAASRGSSFDRCSISASKLPVRLCLRKIGWMRSSIFAYRFSGGYNHTCTHCTGR